MSLNIIEVHITKLVHTLLYIGPLSKFLNVLYACMLTFQATPSGISDCTIVPPPFPGETKNPNPYPSFDKLMIFCMYMCAKIHDKDMYGSKCCYSR